MEYALQEWFLWFEKDIDLLWWVYHQVTEFVTGLEYALRGNDRMAELIQLSPP